MGAMIKKFLPLIFILAFSQKSFSTDILRVFEFNDEEFKKLEVRKIKKKTLVDCTKFVQRDMDVTGLGFMRGQTPFENDIPIILDYDHVEFNPIGRKASCGSGDNFVEDRTNYYGEVVDMEAYALAKVCYHFSIPFISFKYITDGADEQSHEDWEKNLADGIKEFKEKILKEIER